MVLLAQVDELVLGPDGIGAGSTNSNNFFTADEFERSIEQSTGSPTSSCVKKLAKSM